MGYTYALLQIRVRSHFPISLEIRKKEGGRRKKFCFEMGILTRHVCGGSFPHKAAAPTQNKRDHRGWGFKPLYEVLLKKFQLRYELQQHFI